MNSETKVGQADDGLKLNLKRTMLIGLAFMGISMFWQVYDGYVPLFLDHFDVFRENNVLTGLIMAMESILGLFLIPIFGHISDNFKYRHKTGRRVPFIAGGLFFAGLMLIVVNLGHNLKSLPLMIPALVLAMFCMDSFRSPTVSLMPDITAKKIRSNANMVINIMGALGMVIALILSMIFKQTYVLTDANNDPILNEYGKEIIKLDPNAHNWVMFIIAALFMISVALVFIFFVKENRFVKEKNDKLLSLGIIEDEERKEKVSVKQVLKSLTKPEKKSLFFLLLSVFLWYMAYNACTTWFSKYSGAVMGQTHFETPLMVGNAAAFAMFIPAAIIGKKIGRKRAVLIGVGLLGGGFLLGTIIQLAFFSSSVNAAKYAMFPVFILVGAGWAAINVHSFVMSVEFSSEKTNGVFTGIYYVFVMAANAITPLLSGAIFDLIYKINGGDSMGLSGLLPYCLVFTSLAFLTMLFVKHGNTKDKPVLTNE